MFSHPDTLYVTRQIQNQDMERHASQQRLAATALPGTRGRVPAIRQAAARCLYDAALRLAGPEFSVKSLERGISEIALCRPGA